jgi:lysophospholipase L1-like esterase
VKVLDRRGLVNASLVASLLLNALMIAYFAHSGALRRMLLKADLVELRPDRAEFRKEMEARFRKLPSTGAEVVFAGDSLVANGPWAEFYTEVHNRGIGGDTSSDLLGRLDEITEGRPRKLFLLVGANDLSAAAPVAQYLRRYRAILERVRRESPATEIVVLGLLPVNHGFPDHPNFNNARVIETNRRLKDLVGGFPGVRFLDLAGYLADAAGDLRREFTTDGIHINIDGYLAIREALLGPATGAEYRKRPEETPKP